MGNIIKDIDAFKAKLYYLYDENERLIDATMDIKSYCKEHRLIKSAILGTSSILLKGRRESYCGLLMPYGNDHVSDAEAVCKRVGSALSKTILTTGVLEVTTFAGKVLVYADHAGNTVRILRDHSKKRLTDETLRKQIVKSKLERYAGDLDLLGEDRKAIQNIIIKTLAIDSYIVFLNRGVIKIYSDVEEAACQENLAVSTVKRNSELKKLKRGKVYSFMYLYGTSSISRYLLKKRTIP
jgi:hypothetical protein